MHTSKLLQFTDAGIFCPAADIYLDPWKPVARAIVTHGHSDHAHSGMGRYLAHPTTAAIMRHRIGHDIDVQTVEYGKAIRINGVSFSLHPAGHIPGSSQIKVEHNGEVWGFSGDYKLEPDGISEPFEPFHCHTYITESTFGLPVFHWENQETIASEISKWISMNQQAGVASIIFAYSLGKAQRILNLLPELPAPIVMHGAVRALTNILISSGISLRPGVSPDEFTALKLDMAPVVIAPPSAQNTKWISKFRPYSLASASGWMAIQGIKRRRAVDRGFILSDHADFAGLLSAIRSTEASRVFVTHGYTAQFSRYLRELGYESSEAATNYGPEFEETESEAGSGAAL